MFKREWLVVVDVIPGRVLARVRYWDKAGSQGKGDYSVGVLMALTEDDGVYVEHVERGQWSPMERERRILETALADRERKGPPVETWSEQEPGSSGLDSAQATTMALAKAQVRAQFEPVSGDKVVRAGPYSSACQAGRVRLVRGGWNQAYVDELAAFPSGRHDDQVDSSSGAFMKLVRRSASGGIYL